MHWSSDDVPVPDPRRVAASLFLLDLYRNHVISFLNKKVKPGARVDVSAEDILQDMYLLALQGKLLPANESTIKIKRYLTQTAHNLLISRIRKFRRRRESQENPDGHPPETDLRLDPQWPGQAPEPTAEDIFEQLECADQIRETLSRLPVRSQEILALRYIEGLSYEQICERLGIQPETCAKRLNRAKSQFRKQF